MKKKGFMALPPERHAEESQGSSARAGQEPSRNSGSGNHPVNFLHL
jgi:hypothetical protein